MCNKGSNNGTKQVIYIREGILSGPHTKDPFSLLKAEISSSLVIKLTKDVLGPKLSPLNSVEPEAVKVLWKNKAN